MAATTKRFVAKNGLDNNSNTLVNLATPVNSTDAATKAYVDSVVAGKDNTDEITEGSTNLYFTTARARSSVSAGTGISYNSTTGVISTSAIPNSSLSNSSVTVGTTAISLGGSSTTLAGLTSVTSTSFVGALTGNASTVTNGVYTTDTGTVTNTMLAGSIANSKLLNSSITVNGTSISLGGSGSITTSAITEGTNLYYTDARARAAVSAGTGISYNSTTGVITNTITQYTDALARAAVSVSTASASGSGSLAYNSTSGVFTFTPPSLSSYLTAESDTLATVTGRGATTATAVSFTNSTASTTTGTGAVVVTGGVGIGGALNVGGAGSISGALTVGGNLTVNGTTTTVNSTTVTIDDPIFTLGGDTAPASDDNKDRGIEFRWHNGTAAKVGFFGFDDSTGYLTFIPDATNTSEVFSGTAGDIQATNFRGALVGNADTATSAGKWTTARTATVTLTGDVTGTTGVSVDGSGNWTNSVAATLANSGVTAGTYNNVTVDAKGRVTSGSNTAYLTSYTETDTLATVTGRGASTSTAVTFSNATASTTTSTGAVIVTGGVGIGGKLNVGGGAAFTGAITATGEVTAYYSDLRLKTNIVPIADALEKVEAINGVTFDPNETALALGIDNKHQMGVIAQEIEAVAPELVTESAFEGYKTVKYDKLTALLIEAVKELSAKVKTLEAQLGNTKPTL